MSNTLLSGAPYDLKSNRESFYIRDPKMDAVLDAPLYDGRVVPVSFNTRDNCISITAREISFFMEQMPSNCGAVMVSCIEDGRADVITYLAKNIASFLGDKVIFLSCTAGRSADFEEAGWVTGHVAYSARYYGYKMHYMFYTLDESERLNHEWSGDHYEDDDYDDEPYDEEY